MQRPDRPRLLRARPRASQPRLGSTSSFRRSSKIELQTRFRPALSHLRRTGFYVRSFSILNASFSSTTVAIGLGDEKDEKVNDGRRKSRTESLVELAVVTSERPPPCVFIPDPTPFFFNSLVAVALLCMSRPKIFTGGGCATFVCVLSILYTTDKGFRTGRF